MQLLRWLWVWIDGLCALRWLWVWIDGLCAPRWLWVWIDGLCVLRWLWVWIDGLCALRWLWVSIDGLCALRWLWMWIDGLCALMLALWCGKFGRCLNVPNYKTNLISFPILHQLYPSITFPTTLFLSKSQQVCLKCFKIGQLLSFLCFLLETINIPNTNLPYICHRLSFVSHQIVHDYALVTFCYLLISYFKTFLTYRALFG